MMKPEHERGMEAAGGKKRNVMITAHSGCEGTPENSMASIEKGIDLGADCVEIDVRCDNAGKLWLTHDLPEDFSSLVPLEDAFALVRESGVAVNCDLKEYAALFPTLALAEKCGITREQLIFSGSVDAALLERHAEVLRRSRVFLNAEELVRDMLKTEPTGRPEQTAFFLENAELVARRLRALGAEALNAPYQYMPDELIDRLRAGNVALSLWTINQEEALRQFMAKDLLNITTRNVAAALAVRGGGSEM